MKWRIDKQDRDWYCITPQGWQILCSDWVDARNHFVEWCEIWRATEDMGRRR